jgi:hypothetical protein
MAVLITAVSGQDRDGAKPLLWNLGRAFPSVKLALAVERTLSVGQGPGWRRADRFQLW